MPLIRKDGMLTVANVVQALGCTVGRARHLVNSGRIPFVRESDGRRLIHPDDLRAFREGVDPAVLAGKPHDPRRPYPLRPEARALVLAVFAKHDLDLDLLGPDAEATP